MNLGRRFRIYRQRNNLTQAEAAKVLGIKSYQLANYESNRSEPNIKTLKGMSKLYNVSIDLMLGNNSYFESEEYAKSEAENEEYEQFKNKLEKLLKEFKFKGEE